MSALVEIVRAFCLSLPTLSDEEATRLLGGVRGRGDFGPALRDWLHASREVFTETVRVEYPESPTDKGIDVYLEGVPSQTVVGFQIKSDNDVQHEDNFLQHLKAQFAEACLAYGGLKLYIVVLACRPDRFVRLQRVVTDFLQHRQQLQNGMAEVLVLPPGKAAALRQHFATPLSASNREPLLSDRNWNRFFADAGAPDRENEFVQRWPMLAPDERFLPTDNFSEIEASVRDNPLTILAGPPLLGKTFTALQLLWRHYRAGKPVQWIEPMGQGTADCIIPPPGKTSRWKESNRRLVQRLGVRPPQEPLDHHEFVTAQMQPDALILIEDPFGMTDADYDDSLHSYDFFDLDTCIEAIVEGGRRAGCRLLLTTRQMLLEHWMSEHSALMQQRGTLDAVRIIHLSANNYERLKFKGDSQLVEYAAKLLRACGYVSGVDPLETARLIGKSAETPQEIQFVIQELTASSTLDDVKTALSQTQPGATERVRFYCQASTDSERLFLFLLLLTLEGEQHNDFAAVYARLHSALQLPDDAKQDDVDARLKYWPLFYQVVYPKRPSLFNTGIHLKAAHSSVREAARRQIGENGIGFLDRLAEALDRLQTVEHSKHQQKTLAHYLLSEHHRLSQASLRLIAGALPRLIEPSYSFRWRSLTSLILNTWQSLPNFVRNAFFETVRNGDPHLATEVCESFRYHPLPPDDSWRFYDLLTKQRPHMGVGRLNHPWEYFLEHQEEAPQELLSLFDRLATERPDHLSYVLGKLASRYWDTFRPSWQNAILSDQAAISTWKPKTAALEQIFSGLFLGDDAECPAPLLEQLRHHLEHPNPDFRTLAGTFTLVWWEKLPPEFHETLRRLFVTETEAEVLCEILQQGMSSEDNAHDLELAAIAVERANDVMSAILLDNFRHKNRNEPNSQIEELMERCLDKGGDYARAVLLMDVDEKTVFDEPDIIKLAYIHSQTNRVPGHRPLDKIGCPEFIALLQSLNEDALFWAYYVLAHQEDQLPEPLREFIQKGENKDGQIKEAIELGRRHDAETRTYNSRSVPEFPIHSFGPALT